MRLIDGDEAKKRLLEFFPECSNCTIVIDKAPTIYPVAKVVWQDVKHGHWVIAGVPTWKGHHWCCSVCGGHIVTRYPEYPEDAYCKHCGAKMDEEASNEQEAGN